MADESEEELSVRAKMNWWNRLTTTPSQSNCAGRESVGVLVRATHFPACFESLWEDVEQQGADRTQKHKRHETSQNITLIWHMIMDVLNKLQISSMSSFTFT